MSLTRRAFLAGATLAVAALLYPAKAYAAVANGGHETERVSIRNAGGTYFRALMKLPLPTLSGGTPTAATLYVDFIDPIYENNITVSVYSSTDLTWTAASSAATLEAVAVGSVLGSWTVDNNGLRSLDVSTPVLAAYTGGATEITFVLTVTGSTATLTSATMLLGSGGGTWTVSSNEAYLAVTYTEAEARIPAHSGLGGGALMF